MPSIPFKTPGGTSGAVIFTEAAFAAAAVWNRPSHRILQALYNLQCCITAPTAATARKTQHYSSHSIQANRTMAFYDDDMQCEEQIKQQWQEMSDFVAQLLCGNGISIIKRHRRLGARAGKRTLFVTTDGVDCTLVWRHPSSKRAGALPLREVTEVTREGAVVTLHTSNR
eukprot:18930-Heterococcus_DN1.PRE.2